MEHRLRLGQVLALVRIVIAEDDGQRLLRLFGRKPKKAAVTGIMDAETFFEKIRKPVVLAGSQTPEYSNLR
jgi:hypothetical protein